MGSWWNNRRTEGGEEGGVTNVDEASVCSLPDGTIDREMQSHKRPRWAALSPVGGWLHLGPGSWVTGSLLAAGCWLSLLKAVLTPPRSAPVLGREGNATCPNISINKRSARLSMT